jgi:hypothetical protein
MIERRKKGVQVENDGYGQNEKDYKDEKNGEIRRTQRTRRIKKDVCMTKMREMRSTVH